MAVSNALVSTGPSDVKALCLAEPVRETCVATCCYDSVASPASFERDTPVNYV